jgi:hypothetical protein
VFDTNFDFGRASGGFLLVLLFFVVAQQIQSGMQLERSGIVGRHAYAVLAIKRLKSGLRFFLKVFFTYF